MDIKYIGCGEMPENTTEYAVCLGVFDGVHMGHRALVEKTVSRAGELGLKAGAAAFISPCEKGKIYLLEQQAELLAGMGIDTLFAILLDESLRNTSCEEFLRNYLCGYIKAKHVVCGYDYTFGINKSGNAKTIADNSGVYGYSYDIIDKVCSGSDRVSSTLIKALIKDGNIKRANEMLCDDFYFEGCVKCGYRLGRTIGYPTANIELNKSITPIKHGVYSSVVTVNGKTYKGLTNIGTAPTAEKEKAAVTETYIIGFDGNLYNRNVRVCLKDFIREEKKFESMEELKKVISENVRMLVN